MAPAPSASATKAIEPTPTGPTVPTVKVKTEPHEPADPEAERNKQKTEHTPPLAADGSGKNTIASDISLQATQIDPDPDTFLAFGQETHPEAALSQLGPLASLAKSDKVAFEDAVKAATELACESPETYQDTVSSFLDMLKEDVFQSLVGEGKNHHLATKHQDALRQLHGLGEEDWVLLSSQGDQHEDLSGFICWLATMSEDADAAMAEESEIEVSGQTFSNCFFNDAMIIIIMIFLTDRHIDIMKWYIFCFYYLFYI